MCRLPFQKSAASSRLIFEGRELPRESCRHRFTNGRKRLNHREHRGTQRNTEEHRGTQRKLATRKQKPGAKPACLIPPTSNTRSSTNGSKPMATVRPSASQIMRRNHSAILFLSRRPRSALSSLRAKLLERSNQ